MKKITKRDTVVPYTYMCGARRIVDFVGFKKILRNVQTNRTIPGSEGRCTNLQQSDLHYTQNVDSVHSERYSLELTRLLQNRGDLEVEKRS